MRAADAQLGAPHLITVPYNLIIGNAYGILIILS